MKIKQTAPAMSLLLVLALLLSGCQGWFKAGDSTGEEGSGGQSAQQQAIESEVFPKDKVIDVKITIDEADFQDMIDNAAAEEYKEASVDYNGQTFDHVGIRTKGNLSLRSVVNSDSDRYSFKISFDEYVNQTLNGISKINLNNNYSDATYMREFLSYELAASAGLPTPGFSYVNVYINGELWGFYLAVEQVGNAYLERHFGNAYGALYKGVMTGTGSDLAWLGEDPDSYTGLEMKSKSSNGDVLIGMLDELNNGSDYETVLDVDLALKYIALNVAASNMDSYLGMNKQNYYLYENDGVFSILPWDYNMAFGGFGGSGILIDEPTQGAVAERPLVAKLLGVAEYKERYHAILQEMLDGYLQEDTFAKRVEQLKTLISEHVKSDPRPFYTYEQYEEAVPALIAFVQETNENYRQQLDGTVPSSGDGSGSGMGGMGGMGGMMLGGAGGQRPGRNGGQTMPPQDGNGPAPGAGDASGGAAAPLDDSGFAPSDADSMVPPNSGAESGTGGGNVSAGGGNASSQQGNAPSPNGNAATPDADSGAMPGVAEAATETGLAGAVPGPGLSDPIQAVTDKEPGSDVSEPDRAAATEPAQTATESPAAAESVPAAAESPSPAAAGEANPQTAPQSNDAGNPPAEPETGGQAEQPDADPGQQGNRFGGFGGGFGGEIPGGRGGMGPGEWNNAPTQEQNNQQELIYTGISVLLLIAACLIVTLYKRRKL